MIKNIDVLKLLPHPDNPRKDLGDLTELAASIRSQGILQNLTVVPHADGDGFYTVIIGHRRLAAAKLAGLTEVPCAISDMDYKQQVATMLLENIQRNDLTILEQAHGFQMLLDFGESVDDVARRTGFSDATIRRRVKLLELDADKFKASVARGATLQDYAELDKIQDPERRNEVLDAIGTRNFDWKLKEAIMEEAAAINRIALIEKLKTFATQVENMNGMRRVRYIGDSQVVENLNAPEDAGTKKYFFIVENYGTSLLEEMSTFVNDAQSAEQDRIRIGRERHEQLDEINKRAFLLRREFVENFRPKKQQASIIMELAVRAFIEDGCGVFSREAMLEMLQAGTVESDDDEITFDSFAESFATSPERVLLVTAYGQMDGTYEKFYDWKGVYCQNKTIETVYDILEQLGYQISHEELQLIDGTHELYVREDK